MNGPLTPALSPSEGEREKHRQAAGAGRVTDFALSVKAPRLTEAATLPHVNSLTVAIANRQRARKVNRRLLNQITASLLADLQIEDAELGINLVAAPEMTRLNEEFLGHKGSTDVITFDYRLGVPPAGGSALSNPPRQNSLKPEFRTLRGELFICVDEAVGQAKKFRTSWESEMVRYVVHGILHLLGYDDQHAADRRKMKLEENRRLRELSRRFALSKL
jgi:probable rRNA maturation factor